MIAMTGVLAIGARIVTEPAEPAHVPLVRRAQRGDRAAFAALHERYGRAVHAVVLARVRPDDAGDLVQDVFLLAWQRLPDLREPAAFGPWILRIARNAAVDHLRRRPNLVALQDDAGADDAPRAEAQQVLRVVASLPEAYRETLLMRLVEGMTGPEIAERTGLTEGSVRVNLHRGMQILREKLGGGP